MVTRALALASLLAASAVAVPHTAQITHPSQRPPTSTDIVSRHPHACRRRLRSAHRPTSPLTRPALFQPMHRIPKARASGVEQVHLTGGADESSVFVTW